MDHLLILLGTGCLVCLVPMALYFLYAAGLNGRTPPTLVPGPWDFTAVLLGLSGFLLLAGPLLLSFLDSHLRGYLYGNWSELKTIGRAEARAWSLMAGGYLLIVGAIVSFVIMLRRRVTAIYNVHAESVEAAVTSVLDERGFDWRRGTGRIEIATNRRLDPTTPANFAGELASVRIDGSPSAGHALLRWSGTSDGVRHEVEAGLPHHLTVHSPARSPVAGWLYTAAAGIFILLFAWTVVVIYLIVVDRRG